MSDVEDWARAEAEKRWHRNSIGYASAADAQAGAVWMAEHLAERLQSPEVCEAVTDALLEGEGPIASVYFRSQYRSQARKIIAAALDAITKGDE